MLFYVVASFVVENFASTCRRYARRVLNGHSPTHTGYYHESMSTLYTFITKIVTILTLHFSTLPNQGEREAAGARCTGDPEDDCHPLPSIRQSLRRCPGNNQK